MRSRNRRRDFKLRAARVLRPVLAVLLAAVVLVILGYLALQIRKVPRGKPEKKDIVQNKVDLKEKVQVVQFKGNRGGIEVKGDRNYPADEKFYRLEGHVEVLDRGGKGDRLVKMTGSSLTYNKEMTDFVLRGNVRIQFKDLTIEAPDFKYDRNGGFMKTASGATVLSPEFNGSSQKVLFFVEKEELYLEENLRLTVRLRLPTQVPIVLTADRMIYRFLNRGGTIEGNVDIVHGKSRGTADSVFLEEFEVVNELRILRFNGHVIFDLKEEVAGAKKKGIEKAGEGSELQEPTISAEFRFNQSVRQHIEADEIKLQAFMNLPILHVIECRGRSSIKFLYDSGEATQIQGEFVGLSFNKEGGLREIKASEKARIVGLGNNGMAVRLIEGEIMVLDAESGVLQVAGGGGQKARIVSAKSEVSGETVTILINMNDFEAKGGAQMNFRPFRKETENKGFFSKEEPVFATAQQMRYSSAMKRFLLWDQARVWQDKKILSAQEIIIGEESGDISCRGRVRSVFPHMPKDGKAERRIEIGADGMTYKQEVNRVLYENNCSLKTSGAVLQCGKIDVDLSEGGGEARSMRATKGASKAVTILLMNAKDATGEIAEYDVEKDTITLTGRPELKEKDKGTVRGSKLTFHLADGTIRVETQAQERPVPIIKS